MPAFEARTPIYRPPGPRTLDDSSAKEVQFDKPDALDHIITAVCDAFDGIPEDLLKKHLVGPENQSTRLAQLFLMHLLRTVNIEKDIIGNFFSISLRNVHARIGEVEDKLKDPKVKAKVSKLEENLHWIRDLQDVRKIRMQTGDVIYHYSQVFGRGKEEDMRVVYKEKGRIAIHLLKEAGLSSESITEILELDEDIISKERDVLNMRREGDEKFSRAISIMETGIDAIKARRELREAIDRRLRARENGATG